MATIKVRARTVDMLGRQQIAGVPTGISELFKNAHDAYAKRVEIDYYRIDDLFVIRDDGLGMTRDDFEQRWLTLGTESKLDDGGIKPPPIDPEQPLRAVLGEKGIGRLAIAAIGDQLVILTRAKPRRGKPDSLIAAFLHWGVFALPGIDLAQVIIPIAEMQGGSLPSKDDISTLVHEFAENLKTITRPFRKDIATSILESLSKFELDPIECARFLPSGPSLLEDGYGTHFFIKPAEATLKDDIHDPDDDERASPLTKALIGFSNTMTPSHRRPPIVANFRDHLEDGVTVERIGNSTFFTPEEFESADHHFAGQFDKHGQFKGTITIYGKEPVPYVLSQPNTSDEGTRCGPFKINIAYVQGASRESRLPQEEHARLAAKLNRIGGLYIYRDGVRILPYGDSDYDFLEIERRRTKSAGYYFFSYRRMFGVVEISREGNPALVEKAGREGFRQNKAYRQFRDILEHFFVQLAADYFREEGAHSTVWNQTKKELDRDERLRRQREQETKQKRIDFATKLEAVFTQMEAKQPESQVKSLVDELESRLDKLRSVRNKTEAVGQAYRCEADAKNELARIKEHYRLAKPRGWGLTKSLQRDWIAFQTEFARLESEIFAPAEQRIAEMARGATEGIGIDVDKKALVRSTLEELQKEGSRRLRTIEGEVKRISNEAKDRALDWGHKSIARAQQVIEEVLADFESTDVSNLDEEGLLRHRSRWERRISEVIESEAADLEHLRNELQLMGTDASLEASDVTRVLEEEVEQLRERDLAHLELVQVGMALGIIHHEFRGCIKSLRSSLQSLKRWADTNKTLGTLYSDIRSNFDHLDGYLALFTPLTRRLHRTKVYISGSAVFHFLSDLFAERLGRHKIEMIASDGFKQHTVYGFPSSFYPCFVNLVDNSIYWLSDWSGARKITLDATDEGFIIEDTGPGIKPRDMQFVFDLGFTRKPGGQGMGLYVCKETLAKVGYDLILDPYEKGIGARFRIVVSESKNK